MRKTQTYGDWQAYNKKPNEKIKKSKRKSGNISQKKMKMRAQISKIRDTAKTYEWF